MDEIKNEDIEKMLQMLDGFAQSDTSRLKVEMSDDLNKGEVQKTSHHGRCDVGSPWAKGLAFDVLEDDCGK